MKKDLRLHYPLIPKRELKKMIFKSLALTAFAFPALLTISNHNTNPIVIDHLWGRSAEEAPVMLTESDIEHVDVAAVLGGGLQQNGEPNTFQKRRERATAIGIVEFKMADRVLLLDGLKPNNTDSNATKDYFLEQVRLLSNGNLTFPEEAVTVEANSTSTATNLDALKMYMEQHRLNTAVVVTDEFHRVRTEALIKIKGINARVITVEQLMRLHNPKELIAIEQQNSRMDEAWERNEKLKLFSLFFDPQGEKTAVIERILIELSSE